MQRQSMDQLKNMVGTEYILLHVKEPILYVVRKQHRHSPEETTPLADYYIIAGRVYQAPDLASVFNSRILNTVHHLQQAFDDANSFARYHPGKGYSWDFSTSKLGKCLVTRITHHIIKLFYFKALLRRRKRSKRKSPKRSQVRYSSDNVLIYCSTSCFESSQFLKLHQSTQSLTKKNPLVPPRMVKIQSQRTVQKMLIHKLRKSNKNRLKSV
jgi:hypothetical protein